MKYDKLTDVFSAWADAAAGKSMPRWEEYKKDLHKKYSYYIDTEGDVFDTIKNGWTESHQEITQSIMMRCIRTDESLRY